jgi:4-diphosphocytidyl-2-C-methyl-D-erythritol kinase
MEISLPSFAKINLCLRVVGKRVDKYHELETVFQTIAWKDDLRFVLEPGPYRVEINSSDSNIPTDGRNLIHQACDAFHAAFPIPYTITVFLQKRIPMESGLGGGSSNAATTFIALSRMLGWPEKIYTLTEIAAQLGADVPFFLSGGTAFGTGRGDIIAPLEDLECRNLLIVVPGVTCSTAAIYRDYDDHNLLTASANSIKIHLDSRPESLRDFVSRIGNDLERVVFALYPELDSIKKQLLQLGAIAAAVTGSGSAIFGLFENAADLERAELRFDNVIKTSFLTRAEYRSLVLGI